MDILAWLEPWARSITFAPIVACSIVGFAITIDRWRELSRSVAPPKKVFDHLRDLVAADAISAAVEAIHHEHRPGARLIEAALESAGRPRAVVKERVELAGREAVAQLERGLGGLALIASLGPLFGLLGTVVGIVLIFDKLSTSGGAASAPELAGGIGTALFTTIAGILVGILALVFHRFLSARLEHRIGDLELTGLSAVDLVSRDEP